MARVSCRYCELIRERTPRYVVRAAKHAVDSSHPRCDLHWRFECAMCGKPKHFHGVSFCPRERKFYCIDCARETKTVWRRFWAWSYFYRMRCPWHNEFHDGLDRLEFDRRHPWHLWPEWRRSKRGMTRDETLPERWAVRTAPLDSVSDEDVRRGWDDVATWWVTRYTPRGDINREWVIDPVLFRFLGAVKGLHILDAGCGNGYLCRLLARRGAAVEGVELSPKMLAVAKAQEGRKPLGIQYHLGDLADLSRFRNGTFDVAVSNVVLQDIRRYRAAIREIHRILTPHGRFLFSMTHPAFESPVPGTWVREPKDTERIEERRFLAVDRYFDRVAVFWSPPGLPPAVSFHRPLRDFFTALTDAGFLIRRFEEPFPSKKALEKYRFFADLTRIPLFIVVEAVKQKSDL